MPTLRAVAIALAVLLCPALAQADGTYVKEGGGVVMPMRNDDVQLVRETIYIAVVRPTLLSADDTLDVTVTYLFKSHAHRKLAIKMGFPVGFDRSQSYWQADGCLQRSQENAISAFTTTVDGKPAKVRVLPGKRKFKEGCIPDDRIGEVLEKEQEPDGKGFRFDEYHVWDVIFAPGQERTIVNHYRYDATAGIYWEENLLVYVLRTGAPWKDVIEKATIRFHLGDKGCLSEGEGPDGCIGGIDEELSGLGDDPFTFPTTIPENVTPAGAKVRTLPDGTVEAIWELTRFEPDTDVRLGYETALRARKAVRDRIAKIELDKAPRELLTEARDLMRALYGLELPDPGAQAKVASRSWYVRDPRATEELVRKDELYRKIEAQLAKGGATAPKPAK